MPRGMKGQHGQGSIQMSLRSARRPGWDIYFVTSALVWIGSYLSNVFHLYRPKVRNGRLAFTLQHVRCCQGDKKRIHALEYKVARLALADLALQMLT